MGFKDTAARAILRRGYVAFCGAAAAANLVAPRRNELAVYYGGARSGDVGGPLVKVRRLREYFPEVRWGYNLVYVLSNAPYLPAPALRLLKRRGIPIVHNQNGVFYKAWYAGDWQAQNRQMAQPYHAADWVFYQSEFCRRAADLFLGPREGAGEILYNAVDTGRFSPSPGGAPGSDGYRFLVTGKIGNHLYYRLESTIAGLRVARARGLDARLTIAGWIELEARGRAEALAASLGVADSVTFTGPYGQQQAPDIYRAADAYVMTKHNDPCPNTVIEALASGLPVLYSDSGGTPELVGTSAGVALPCAEDWEVPHAPDAQAVGEGMLRIAEGRAGFAAAARRRAVEKFDIAHWIARHREVFHQLQAAR
ncbi:MAG: glycosyltransferase family 4 protein [Vicinamibacterales bacterium]|jgi:glycosyltransferase involved in cell wall biosynthesis